MQNHAHPKYNTQNITLKYNLPNQWYKTKNTKLNLTKISSAKPTNKTKLKNTTEEYYKPNSQDQTIQIKQNPLSKTYQKLIHKKKTKKTINNVNKIKIKNKLQPIRQKLSMSN